MESWPMTGETVEENDGGGGIGGGGGKAQQTRRLMIRWERFLPTKSLRFLLVEPDNSTRHIVTALLRKCSYHVEAVGDGVKAWELMSRNRYSFDLVLTEVSMPSLSGIGLLTKIVGADESKNIPVIMMSAHDSVGVVLKCMLKGAVDFLVKPVRKNELRNLWQHVWRRHCCGNNGNASDNNAASNHPSANADNMSGIGENSKENIIPVAGSKQEAETQSVLKNMEPVIIEGNQYKLENKTINTCDDTKIDCNLQLRGSSAGRGVELATVQGVSHFKDNNLNHSSKSSSFTEQLFPSANSNCQNGYIKNGYSGIVGCSEPIVHSNVNFHLQENHVLKDNLHKGQSKETDLKHSDTCQLFHPSLRRPQFNGFKSQELKGRSALNHSQSSAFSRYSERKNVPLFAGVKTKEPVTANQCDVACCAKEQYSLSKLVPGESTLYIPVHPSNGETENSRSLFADIQRNDTTVASSTDHDFSHHPHQHNIITGSPGIHISGIPSQTMCVGFGGSLLGPVFHPDLSMLHNTSGAAIDVGAAVHTPLEQAGRISDALQPVQLHHPRETDLGEPRSSFSDPEQANKGGYSNNDSCETAADDMIINAWESIFVNNGGRGLVCDRSHRAAALLKFRMKRKDRCFEKKVRYFSRQKLAKQRPRVKGQFVSQKNQGPSPAE